MKRKLFSILLSAALCISMMPGAAFAEDTGGSGELKGIADTYEVEGTTYYNVDSKHFEDSSKLFIKDLLTADSSYLAGKSPAELWQYLAFCIQDDSGEGTETEKFKTQFDNVIPKGLTYNTGSYDSKSSSETDDDNTYNVCSSGLTYAESIASAATAMEKQIFDDYTAAGGGREDQYGDSDDAAVAKNETLAEKTAMGDVFWMLTGAYKTSGTNKKGHYQAIGVIFSNPTITTILPDDDDDFYKYSSTEPTTGSKAIASTATNDTGETSHSEQSVSQTNSLSTTSEVNGSAAYSYEEGFSIGGYIEKVFGARENKFNISGQFTFNSTQTIEDGWSESNATTQEQSVNFNEGIDLPPCTTVQMKQETTELTETTEYNCPVALNYAVTIVEYTLDPSSNNADCKTQVLATIGTNARKDLYQRAVIEESIAYNGISWSTLFSNHSGLKTIVQDQLAVTAPMSSTGATFTTKVKCVSNEIAGLVPIYPLKMVRSTAGYFDYSLFPGQSLYLNNIPLEGLNAQYYPYYGFVAKEGYWVLMDEDGNELTESNVAILKKDPVTGYTSLTGGTEAGTVYVKYMINENIYSSSQKPSEFTTNKDLSSTAVIKVVVEPEYTESDYFYDSVNWALENGIAKGTSEYAFSPYDSCTRAQMVTFLWRAAGSPEPQSQETSFSDVDASAYYGKAVLWAEENGITQGADTGRFYPDRKVSRGQAVTFLSRAQEAQPTEIQLPFTDVSPDSYYCDSVKWALAEGITEGTTETTFSPDADCTRAQIVTFLFRALA